MDLRSGRIAFLLLVLASGNIPLLSYTQDPVKLEREFPSLSQSHKIDAALRLSRFYRSTDPKIELYFAQLSLRLAEQKRDYRRQGKAAEYLAHIHLRKKQWKPTFEYFLKSLDIYYRFNSREPAARVNLEIGKILMNPFREYHLALDFISQSLSMLEKEKRSPAQLEAALLAKSRCCQKLGQYLQAVQILKQAYRLHPPSRDISRACSLLLELSDVYATHGSGEMSVESLYQALYLCEKFSFPAGRGKIYARMAERYHQRGETSLAEDYDQKASESGFDPNKIQSGMRTNSQPPPLLSGSFRHLLNYYIHQVPKLYIKTSRSRIKPLWILPLLLLIVPFLLRKKKNRPPSDTPLIRNERLSNPRLFLDEIQSTLITQEARKLQSRSKSIEEDKCLKKLMEAMEKEKLFLDPELTLQGLARKLSISQHLLSEVINQHTGKNFHDFINQYRVSEAKRLLRETSTENKITLESIYRRSGFNTRASFNRIFKLYTQTTPRDFRNQPKTSDGEAPSCKSLS